MTRKVAMIHTVANVAPLFDGLAAEIMPGAEVMHFVDEGLLKDIINGGELTEERIDRIALLASFAVDSGAEAVMLTCSTVGPGVDEARDSVLAPFLRVDQAMADRAVELGGRVGVIASLHTTLGPTSDLIRARAALQGRGVELEIRLCDGAFEALNAGDVAGHDRIVIDNLRELMGGVDVVVLAQASMSRVVELLPEAERVVPILSSPRLGVAMLRDALEAEDAKRC